MGVVDRHRLHRPGDAPGVGLRREEGGGGELWSVLRRFRDECHVVGASVSQSRPQIVHVIRVCKHLSVVVERGKSEFDK